ncbi:hypothetical protein [Embleya sp. MST-111070]|uniref:hypothetical protein n=1 Tax=Embleya sp. MST-111070 TaxID=3398231 RepID=UPI003F738351
MPESTSPASTAPATGDTGTAPADPTTGAPGAPSTPPTTPAAPATDPAVEQQLAEAKRAAEQAATERDKVHEALRKLLDPDGAAGDTDPAKLAEQAAAERDSARDEARRLRVELAAHQAAHRGGADPARLLDSRAVAEQLAALDPTDPKFAEQLDKVISAAVEANPLLRGGATATGPATGGADFTGGPAPQLTAEQFAGLAYGARVELFNRDPDLYRQLSAATE